MVFCTYCGQSFTRDEHLERHILTHTNVKPFKCFTCHMSFARRDLLQRHYTVHGKDANNQDIVPAANGMIPRSAGRTPIACSNCAKTKTKCDKKFPCSRCSARNLKCTLRPTRRATKTAARTGVVPGQAESGTSEGDAPAAQEPSEDENSKGSPGSPEQQSLPRPIAPASPKSLSPDDASRPQTTTGSPSLAQQNVPAHDVSPPMVSNILPPSTTAGVPFVPSSTIAGLEDLSQLSPGHPADPNSRFMLDWAQMQTPIPYENIMQPQMMVSPEMAFDMHAFPMPPHHEGMMAMMPDMSHGLASSLITPIETPKMLQRHMSEIALGSSVGSHSIPSSQHPSYHQSYHMHPYMGPPPQPEYPQAEDEGEMAAIIAAQDAWSVFRCGPTIPSASCPKTALPNLERLRRTLGNFSEWNVWSPSFDEADMLDNEALTVMQVHESSRDKLFAISQSFLQKAFDIHGRGPTYAADSAATFPPAHVLSYFIRAYANCFERYFPLTPKGTVCVNELLHCHNNSLAASLLVLMMIAQGAVDIPSAGARMLTGGLTEVCRISLFDLIEKNINLASDHTVLHAALLFTVQAAWSGDKWQMDIAMGQRGMYFAMLRHSGALGFANQGAATGSQPSNTDKLWCDWIDNEKRSRLVYSWVMVDQDMALFHDCAPLFSVSEFAAPMPDADRLWHAKSAVEWSSIFEQVHEFGGNVSSLGSGARPLSLSQLFRHFLNDELIPRGIEMTPLQLRLLLHPLQSLLSQFNQLLSCFSDPTSDRNENIPRKVSASSTRNRVEEVQSLLGKWYDLAERYLKANPMCPMMQTNLVIFHLVSLNAVTDFPEIERLSRGEIMAIDFQSLLKTHKRCIFDVEEAVYHCGQVFRLVRSMPRNTRPPWWAGAIYRVALVLWTDSQMVKEDPPANNGMYPVSGPTFPIDRLMPEHPLIIRYLTKGEGSPCVTKRDGTQLSIDRPLPLMRHCVEVIDEGASTRFSDGIRSKLKGLCTRA